MKKTLLDVAWTVAQEEGVEALSIRSITRKSDCSLGHFYNFFESGDDLFFHINARTVTLLFDALNERLSAALKEAVTLEGAFRALGRGYVEFAEGQKKLWKALFECSSREDVPAWYKEKVRTQLKALEDRLSTHLQVEAKKMHQMVTYFWAAMHGISSIVLNRKIYVVEDHVDEMFIDRYVNHCIEGVVSCVL